VSIAGLDSLDHSFLQFTPAHRPGQIYEFSRLLQAVQMGVQEIDISLNTFKSLENAVTAVDHMVVYGYEHQGRVSDNPSIPGGIHGRIGVLMIQMHIVEPGDGVFKRESGYCRHCASLDG
jgi:hypothetical protein